MQVINNAKLSIWLNCKFEIVAKDYTALKNRYLYFMHN